jgi:hypothetical protein
MNEIKSEFTSFPGLKEIESYISAKYLSIIIVLLEVWINIVGYSLQNGFTPLSFPFQAKEKLIFKHI